MATSFGQDGMSLLRERVYLIMGKVLGRKLKKTLTKRKKEGKKKRGKRARALGQIMLDRAPNLATMLNRVREISSLPAL